MRKRLKNLGVVFAVLALTVALGVFKYAQRGQQDNPMIDFGFEPGPGGVDFGFLCEWHYPATNGVPEYVEVCYYAGQMTQCYRIEGNHVTDYHCDYKNRLRKEISRITEPQYYRGESRPQHEKDLIPEEFDLCYQEKWRPYAIRDIERETRPFGVDGLGHITVLTWEWTPLGPNLLDAGCISTDRCAVVVYPLNEASPAVNALRDAVKDYMADPSTREYHAFYVRGYPVLSPDQPNSAPVLEGGKTCWNFQWRQRDVLRFIPYMDRALIPIEKGVNPFKEFKIPFVHGSSLMLNYKSQEEDWRWYLHGDNFWRVEVYEGNSN